MNISVIYQITIQDIVMSSINWRGVFPAVTTKFNPDDSLDFEAMARHLEFQLDAGVHGIIILRSLGENSTLDMQEKLAMVQFFSGKISGTVITASL